MNLLDRIAQGMLRPINPYSTLILGVFTALWGLWLAMPTWDVFVSSPLYHEAERFAPEWAWGTWSMVCGLLILFALFTERPRALSWALGFAVWHWSTIALMFWWGDWHNTGGLNYSFITVFTAYAWLNYKINFVRKNKTTGRTRY